MNLKMISTYLFGGLSLFCFVYAFSKISMILAFIVLGFIFAVMSLSIEK